MYQRRWEDRPHHHEIGQPVCEEHGGFPDHGKEAEGEGNRGLFPEERLLYGESSKECGKMGILRNFLVFMWCLKLCYETIHTDKIIFAIFLMVKIHYLW